MHREFRNFFGLYFTVDLRTTLYRHPDSVTYYPNSFTFVVVVVVAPIISGVTHVPNRNLHTAQNRCTHTHSNTHTELEYKKV